MTWARLDDGFHTNPKILGLTDRQFRLYVTSITYAAHYLTDGFLTDEAVRVLGAQMGLDRPKSVANALANAKLFHREDGGYRIHDYLTYNPTKAHVERERAKTAERVKRHRNAVTNAVTNPVSNDAPTRSNAYSQESKSVTTSDADPAQKRDVPASPKTVTAQAVQTWWRNIGVHVPDPHKADYLARDLEVDPQLADRLLSEARAENPS